MPILMPTEYAGILGGTSRLRETLSSVTCNVNNTTGSKVAFTLTGGIYLWGLWGEVTTAISSNHTGGFFRLNDQTAVVNITATGITLSSLAVGTTFQKYADGASAMNLSDNATGVAASAAAPFFGSVMHLVKKNGAVTTIDYRYATTNTPSSGVILVHALWTPATQDGNLVGN